MSNWLFKLCIPVASAAVLAGCTQEVQRVGEQDQNRTPIDGSTGKRSMQNLPIALTGCLSPGTGNQQYVLTHVRPSALQPSDQLSAMNLDINDNSAVRLAINDDEPLKELVGQTVEITGTVKHDGRDTIGTSGQHKAPDQPGPRVDQSQAAAGQHHSEKVREEAGPIGNQSMNNGTYPEIFVTQVNRTGERCVAAPVGGR